MIPLNVEWPSFYSFKCRIFNETEEFESVNLDHLFYLLVALSNSRSLDTFKKHLKTHYFKEHFYGI